MMDRYVSRQIKLAAVTFALVFFVYAQSQLGLFHELINWSIAESHGVNASITLHGELATDDCPWSCSKPYISSAWTTESGPGLQSIQSNDVYAYVNMQQEFTANESPIGQSLPYLLMLLGIGVCFNLDLWLHEPS